MFPHSAFGWIGSKFIQIQPVSLSLIAHNDLPGYVASGYGARPIPDWPFYQFIQLYLRGSERECLENWAEWLIDQFMQHGTRKKSRGGMYQGSVHQNAAQLSLVDTERAFRRPKLLTIEEVKGGAEVLIRERLQMVSSIANHGYRPALGDTIFAVKKNNVVILKGGHHRAATLFALGYKEIPELHVLSRNGWRVRQCLMTTRKISHF